MSTQNENVSEPADDRTALLRYALHVAQGAPTPANTLALATRCAVGDAVLLVDVVRYGGERQVSSYLCRTYDLPPNEVRRIMLAAHFAVRWVDVVRDGSNRACAAR